MRVERLTLTNFRSYAQAEFELGERTVVVGPNAAGKTNLLEALYLLSATKSFRADREREMIRWGETAGRVALSVSGDDGRSEELVCQLALGPRTIKKTFSAGGVKRRASEMVRSFPAALFSADDVRLVGGAPGRRRRALDLLIGQSSPRYLEALRKYTRVVASRNRLLEQVAGGEAGPDELDFWDAQLIEQGGVLLSERQRFVAFANERLAEFYAGIAGTGGGRTKTELRLVYEPLSTDLAADIPARRRQDVAVGTTTAGPHRDDWQLILGNRPLVSFGSGGEFRSAMLAFRLAEAAWLTAELAVVPAVLLDDVFSELDQVRRAALLASLPASQVIITTPDAEVLPAGFADAAAVISIGRPETNHV